MNKHILSAVYVPEIVQVLINEIVMVSALKELVCWCGNRPYIDKQIHKIKTKEGDLMESSWRTNQIGRTRK